MPDGNYLMIDEVVKYYKNFVIVESGDDVFLVNKENLVAF